jgi:hypothetical protein
MDRFDHGSWILVLTRLEDTHEANQVVGRDDPGARSPRDGCVAATGVNREAGTGRLTGCEVQQPFSTGVLGVHHAAFRAELLRPSVRLAPQEERRIGHSRDAKLARQVRRDAGVQQACPAPQDTAEAWAGREHSRNASTKPK